MNEPLRQTSTLAIVSLITGVLGWTALPLIGSVIAIITGHLARAEIRRNPATLGGDGLAVAGLLLGYLLVAVAVAAVVAVVLLFGGLAAFFALAGHWT